MKRQQWQQQQYHVYATFWLPCNLAYEWIEWIVYSKNITSFRVNNKVEAGVKLRTIHTHTHTYSIVYISK